MYAVSAKLAQSAWCLLATADNLGIGFGVVVAHNWMPFQPMTLPFYVAVAGVARQLRTANNGFIHVSATPANQSGTADEKERLANYCPIYFVRHANREIFGTTA